MSFIGRGLLWGGAASHVGCSFLVKGGRAAREVKKFRKAKNLDREPEQKSCLSSTGTRRMNASEAEKLEAKK
jgi:hypothetical protein